MEPTVTVPDDEPARLAALATYDVINDDEDPVLDRVTRILSASTSFPIALVSFVTEDEVHFRSAVGLGRAPVPRPHSVCSTVILSDDELVVEDLAGDDRFARCLPVTQGGLRFYAGVPIAAPNGQRIGAVCVMDHEPSTVSDDDLALLREASAVIADELERQREESLLQLAVEAREAQAALVRSVLAAVPDPVLTLDRDGQVLSVTDGLRAMLGTDAVPPALASAAAEAAAAGGSATIRVVLTHREGHTVHAELRARRLAAATGEAHAVAVVRDVSEQVAYDVALEQAKSVADDSDVRSSRLVREMSRHLRTPMNSVLGYAELLSNDSDDPQVEASLGYVRDAAEHLRAMVDDLADLTALDAGEHPIDVRTVRVGPLVQAAIALARANLTTHGTTVRWEPVDEASWVRADARALRQVVINLLTNAAIHGGDQVTVRVTVDDGETTIDVHDDGPGIPADAREAVFLPFERLEHGRPGTGLGLPLSRRLVRAVGGDLSIADGPGTTFRVRLVTATAPLQAQPTRVRVAAAPSAVTGRVLWADDHPGNLELVRRTLERLAGIELVTALDGQDALRAAATADVDLVMLDRAMPGSRGDEVARQLRALGTTADLPIAIVSADLDPGYVKDAFAAGVDAYLGKPLPPAAILALTRSTLGARPGDRRRVLAASARELAVAAGGTA